MTSKHLVGEAYFQYSHICVSYQYKFDCQKKCKWNKMDPQKRNSQLKSKKQKETLLGHIYQ